MNPVWKRTPSFSDEMAANLPLWAQRPFMYALKAWYLLIFDCVSFWLLVDFRLVLVELVVFAVRARRNGKTCPQGVRYGAVIAWNNNGTIAESCGTANALCLQGVLTVLLKVVSMGTAASNRRNKALYEAGQRANLPPDIQAALQAETGRCPITRELMHDPVRTCEWSASRPGVHVYEREAIEQWLRTSSMSPCTGLPLDRITLEPCLHTRALVRVQSLFERLVAAEEQIPLPLCRWGDRALELAADCAAAMGRVFLSDFLGRIDIDADVVCNRGGEGKPAMFVWTGSLMVPQPRSGCAVPCPVKCPVFELFPGMTPMGFVQAPDGQVGQRYCMCCGQALPRGAEDMKESLSRTDVGCAMQVGYYPFVCVAFCSSFAALTAVATIARTVCVG